MEEKKEDKLKHELSDAMSTMEKLVKKINEEIEESKKPNSRGKEELGNGLTLLDIAELDEKLIDFVKRAKVKKQTGLIKEYFPQKSNLYEQYRKLAKYYYRKSIVPKEEEWTECLQHYSNLVYVMQENNVVDAQRTKQIVKELEGLPKNYDEKFKKKCKDKIKDKAPSYFLEFVVKTPSLINAINNSPKDDSDLRENLLKQFPTVGSGSFLIAPPKLWLTLSIILNELIADIKMWANEKVEEAVSAEKAKKKK